MSAKGVNRAIIIGNLGKDPEVRYSADGNAIANITIATSQKWKDKNGQLQEETEWHQVSFFGRLAEVVGEYLRKGGKVYVEGRLKTRKYQASDGSDRYSTSIIASEMQMLDSAGGGQQNSSPQNNRQQSNNQNNQQSNNQNNQQNRQQSNQQSRQQTGSNQSNQSNQQNRQQTSSQPQDNNQQNNNYTQNNSQPASQVSRDNSQGTNDFDDDIGF